MKVNYVIATWSGKNTKRSLFNKNWGEPTPENTLKMHLEYLNKQKHTLSQITIMKPYCDPENQYQGYYNNITSELENCKCPVIQIECENLGYSNGQWLKAYEIFGDEFDYYIFIEDDYCAFADNFDNLLIEYYKTKFPTNIGKLCGFVEGYPRNIKHPLPEHYDSIVCLSSNTLQKVYFDPLWNSEPRSWLDKDIENTVEMNNVKIKYKGAFNQINFTLLFTKINIPLDDYCANYPVPYFAEEQNKMHYLIHNHRSIVNIPISSIENVFTDRIHICVPLQFIVMIQNETQKTKLFYAKITNTQTLESVPSQSEPELLPLINYESILSKITLPLPSIPVRKYNGLHRKRTYVPASVNISKLIAKYPTQTQPIKRELTYEEHHQLEMLNGSGTRGTTTKMKPMKTTVKNSGAKPIYNRGRHK